MQAARRVCRSSHISHIETVVPRSRFSSHVSCTFRTAQRPTKSVSRDTPVFQPYRPVSAEATARELSQQSVDELAEDVDDNQVEEAKEKQHKRPWMREGVDHAPVRRQRSAGAMTKGKGFSARYR